MATGFPHHRTESDSGELVVEIRLVERTVILKMRTERSEGPFKSLFIGYSADNEVGWFVQAKVRKFVA